MKKRILPRRGELPQRPHEVGALGTAILDHAASLSAETVLHVRRLEPWITLRKKVTELDDETHAKLIQWATTAREKLPLEQRFGIAFLFDGHPDFAERDLRLSLANPTRVAPMALAVARDPALLVEAGTPMLEYDAGMVSYFALEIARTFESDVDTAARIIVAYADAYDAFVSEGRISGTFDQARTVSFGDTLACIGSPVTATFMASRIGNAAGRRYASRFFRRFPALAKDALEPLITGRGRKREAAEALLADAMARSGNVAATAAAAEEIPEAPPELVPDLLRDPPWRNWKKAKLPIIEIDDMPSLDIPFEATKGMDREAWITRLPSVPRANIFSSRGAFNVAHAWLQRRAERAAAREWLEAFAPFAIFGLLPFALGEPGSARTISVPALRMVWKVGGDDRSWPVVERWAQGARVPVAHAHAAVRAVLEADPIWDCPDKAPAWPQFLPDGVLPNVLLKDREHRLGQDARRHLVELLSFAGAAAGGGDLVPTYRGVEIVRVALDEESTEDLAWAIYRAWSAQGGSRITWPMDALALFGGPRTARNLAQQIRSLVTERSLERAKEALEVLGRLSGEMTLVQLHRIAESSANAELRTRARVLLDHTAKERGIAKEDLEDLLVPDLGLDENGTMRLDFGPRAFELTFDQELRLAVRDGEGHVSKTLPKANKKDDAEKAAHATETFKGLKRDAEDAIKGQVRRLERSMCAQRRWERTVFEERLVRHPLLRHIARRLVWAVASDALVTFRVAEDLTFANEHDEPFTLPHGARIALPHPLEVDEALRRTWESVFADYAVYPPFPQMSREVYVLDGEASLAPFKGKMMPGSTLFAIEHRGWSRPPHGYQSTWTKRFGALDAHIDVNGRPGRDDVALMSVYLTKEGKPASVTALSAIEGSELLRDLTRMIEGR